MGIGGAIDGMVSPGLGWGGRSLPIMIDRIQILGIILRIKIPVLTVLSLPIAGWTIAPIRTIGVKITRIRITKITKISHPWIASYFTESFGKIGIRRWRPLAHQPVGEHFPAASHLPGPARLQNELIA